MQCGSLCMAFPPRWLAHHGLAPGTNNRSVEDNGKDYYIGFLHVSRSWPASVCNTLRLVPDFGPVPILDNADPPVLVYLDYTVQLKSDGEYVPHLSHC